MSTAPPPAAPAPDDDSVLLIADPRLDALRGQTLVVGDCIVAIPVEPGPFPVPTEAARILVRQAGWRLADPGRVLKVDGPPPPSRQIPNPQRTRDDLGRLQTARVASPSAAEMAAREHRQGPTTGLDTMDAALVLETLAAHIAATPPAGTTTGAEAEEAAVPQSAIDPAPVLKPAPTVERDPLYVSEPASDPGSSYDSGSSSSSSYDAGGSSYDAGSSSSDSSSY